MNNTRTSKSLFETIKHWIKPTRNNVWVWIGRIIPLLTLLVTVLFLALAPSEWIDWFLITLAGMFGVTTFIFWWWLVYALTTIYQNQSNLEYQLTQVTKELVEAKELIAIKTKNLTQAHVDAFNEATSAKIFKRRKSDNK